MNESNLREAITAWKNILGPEHVGTTPEELEFLSKTTFHTSQNILAAIFPKNTDEVIACVKIANQYRIPIYPCSTGNNWGLGNAVPASNNNVILHLRRMKQITEFDADLACITVEPGVTQKQIYEFLAEKKSDLMFGVTGSSPETSAIGNMSERGDCANLEPERANMVCNLGIVLPTGDYIETGFGAYQNAKTKGLSRFGVGPAYDGIFQQSNFGIITKATFWLTPKPKYLQAYVFTIDDKSKLDKLIDKLRQFKLSKFVPNNIFIWNNYKLLALFEHYPWDMTQQTPLPAEMVKSLSKKHRLGEWVGIIPLYAVSPLHAKAQKKYIRSELKNHVDSLLFLNKKRIKIFDFFAPLIKKIFKFDINKITMLLKSEILLGKPSEAGLSSLYWRKKSFPNKKNSPIKDNCGLLWSAIAVPFKGKDIAEASTKMTNIILSHGFEPNLALLAINERIITMAVAIVYDRGEFHADEKAEQCHFEMMRVMTNMGYIPNRLAINSFDKLPSTAGDYQIFNLKIKQALDPNQILAPNRYIINDKVLKILPTIVLVDPISCASKYLTLFKDKYDLIVVLTLDMNYIEQNFSDSLELVRSAASRVISGSDVDETLAQLNKPINAVIPCSEPGVIFANLLSARLGLISNHTTDIGALRDKSLMREVFHRNKVTCPKFIKTAVLEEALNFSRENGFPLVCKNPLGAGGNLVFICESEKELEQGANKILQSRGIFDEAHPYFVVEKHIKGNEFCVNLFNDGKKWVLLDIWQYEFINNDKLKHGPLASALQLNKKTMDPILLDQLYKLAIKGSEALNIQFGPAHCEIIQNTVNNELYLIEIGARLPGANFPWMIYNNNKVDLYQKTIEIFTQGSCHFTQAELDNIDRCNNAVMFFYATNVKNANKINGFSGWEQLPSYFSHSIVKEPKMGVPKEWADACGLLYLSNVSQLQLLSDMKKARKLFRINNYSVAA